MSEENNPKIEVRRARLTDYEGVLDINRNVYQGFDYMPYQYETLITDPDFVYFVCVVDGEIAALEGVCLLDDKRTCMMRSLRVKEKYAGQGLSSLMRAALYEELKSIPKEKRLRSGCSEQIRYVRSKRYRNENKLLHMERNVHYVLEDVRKMIPVTQPSDSQSKSISWDQFAHLIQIESVRDYLFPEKMITANYWFFDVSPSNIRHIKKLCPTVFVTQDLYKFLPEISNSNSTNGVKDTHENTNQNGSKIDETNICDRGLMGIVSHYLSPEYDYNAVNISGKPTKGNEVSEIRLLAQETIAFMQDVYKNSSPDKAKTVLSFVCPLDWTQELFDQVVEPFGINPIVWEPEFHEQYYFEQDFEKLKGVF